jgi:hypothetical protein
MNNSGALKRILLMLFMVLTVTFATRSNNIVLLAGGENCPYPFDQCSHYASQCESVCTSNGKTVGSFNCTEAPANEPNTCVTGSCVCQDPDPCANACNTYGSQSTCESCACFWNTPGVCSEFPSPIMINLKSNSSNYLLTAAADGVAFDFYGTGIPMRVAWTSPHSSVAFLVLDRNGNGTIDSGAELFGNLTPKRDGTMAAHGFEALLDLDGGVGVSDGRMSVGDPFYSQLRLWIDRNHNGYSEVDELTTLAESGLTTIFTAYSESRRRDKYGNFYKYEGTALLARRNEEVARRVFDVFFAVEN